MEYLGLGLCLIVIYLIISKTIKIKTYNSNIEKLNKQLEEDTKELTNAYNLLLTRRKELQENVSILTDQAEKNAKAFFDKSMEKAQSELEYSLEKVAKYYQEEEEKYKNTYLQVIVDMGKEYVEVSEDYKKMSDKLKDLSSVVEAAVEAAKRKKEMEDASNFYRLILPQNDLDEIARLREVAQYLRDAEPLNKVIWKVYYEKPYTDLIGRIFGNKKPTGIYKITNIENSMCYVGQAISIPDRWKQHIKRGLGAEAATRNKLYPAMKEFGVENFTFELIEECSKEKLDEREDFWQDYFKAKEFGYSIK